MNRFKFLIMAFAALFLSATFPAQGQVNETVIEHPNTGWWNIDRDYRILYSKQIKVNNGYKDYNLMLLQNRISNPTLIPNKVTHIAMIPVGSKCNEVWHFPDVEGIVYHDLGPGKEFLGLKTLGSVSDKDGNYIGRERREFIIDDDTANFIIAIFNGDSKYKLSKELSYEETKAPGLLYPGDFNLRVQER